MTRQVTGISSMATRQILADLGAAYLERSGVEIAIKSLGGVEAARQVRAGQPIDVVVLAATVMEQLEAEGHIAPGTRVAVARSAIAVAVRAGARRPGLEDEEAVNRAMLDAGAVGYSTGPSGDHLVRLWERWGVADAMIGRAVQAPPGVPVGAMVASGKVELGIQQLSELLHVPGIEVVGLLPPAIQATTVFTAGVAATSDQPDKARGFLDFLVSPETEAVKRRYGMEPA
jgi:molybdate transport system substrate-binding protein